MIGGVGVAVAGVVGAGTGGVVGAGTDGVVGTGNTGGLPVTGSLLGGAGAVVAPGRTASPGVPCWVGTIAGGVSAVGAGLGPTCPAP